MKHAPATPLPWQAGITFDDCPVFSDHGGRIASCEGREGLRIGNSAYIAHAANAYPRLIEALRDHVAFSPNTPTSDAARALLRELGEDA